eukprot:8690413-Pyramimonas_sp.AAC.1
MAHPTACACDGSCRPIQLPSMKACPDISAGPPPNHCRAKRWQEERGHQERGAARRRGRGG